jgi:hypothetical protein
VLGVVVLFASGLALAATTSVALTPQGPQPATVTVEWGDTVAFANQDSVARGVNSPRAGLENVQVAPGATLEHRFDGRAGRYVFTQTGPRPQFTGAITVTASGRVTLAASKRVVPFGSTITLSGRSTYAGTPVDVQYRQLGSGEWKSLATPTAGGDGSYSARVRLDAGGRVRSVVAAGQVASPLIDVTLVPRLRASVSRRSAPKGTRIVVTGRVAPGSAVNRVDLEQRLPNRRTWLRQATKSVRNGVVKFTLRMPEGRSSLRLSVNRSSLDPGFAPTTTPALVVVGT